MDIDEGVGERRCRCHRIDAALQCAGGVIDEPGLSLQEEAYRANRSLRPAQHPARRFGDLLWPGQARIIGSVTSP